MSPHPDNFITRLFNFIKSIITDSFKYFESIVTQWKMFLKMTICILAVLSVVHGGILYIIYKHSPQKYLNNLSANDLCIFRAYTVQSFLSRYIPFRENFSFDYVCGGSVVAVDVQFSKFKEIYQRRYEEHIVPTLIENIKNVLKPTCFIYVFYFVLLIVFSKKYRENVKEKHIRGAVLKTEQEVAELLDNDKYDGEYKFKINDRLAVPESINKQHNCLFGSSGAGKSTLTYSFLDQLLNDPVMSKKSKVIVHDFKGDYIPKFYNPKKHYIFNPLDKRHMGLDDDDCRIKGWSIFNELRTEPDCEALIKSTVSENKNADPIWHTAPRDILYSMLFYCKYNGKTLNRNLLDTALMAPDELRSIFESFPEGRYALQHLEEPKLSGQFMAILATSTRPYKYLADTDGNFSIKDWIADPNPEKRVIFISNHAQVRATLSRLIGTFFDFAITTLNSLPDSNDRRIDFVLEELGQLPRMDSLLDLLTVSRSKGGVSWISAQDKYLMQRDYGSDMTNTIINNCQNKYFFRTVDPSSAEAISQQISSAEISKTEESKSFGVEDFRDNISIHPKENERRVVMPSEIIYLDRLSLYMKLSDLPVTKVKIEYKNYPDKCIPFDPRDLSIERNMPDDPDVSGGYLFFEQCAEMFPQIEDVHSLVPDECIPEIPSDAQYKLLNEINNSCTEQTEAVI